MSWDGHLNLWLLKIAVVEDVSINVGGIMYKSLNWYEVSLLLLKLFPSSSTLSIKYSYTLHHIVWIRILFWRVFVSIIWIHLSIANCYFWILCGSKSFYWRVMLLMNSDIIHFVIGLQTSLLHPSDK